MGKAKQHILPFFIPHQGCPNQCIFCNQHRITGIGQEIDYEEIERQILGIEPGQEMEVAFYGGSFSGLPFSLQQRLLEPAWQQKQKGYIHHVRVSTRPDYIDVVRLRFLQKYGVDTIEIGAQSLDDAVLNHARRGHNCQDIENAVRLIQSFGFHLVVQLLPGLPGDCYEKAIFGAKTVADWHPDGVRIYPAVVLKDTPLYDLYEAGCYQPLSVEKAVIWCRDMAAVFLQAGITIIRIGLQPSEDIQWNSGVIAGAFHPAFGQLTQSALALAQCEMLLCGKRISDGDILVPEKLLSTFIGQKKKNLLYLQEKYGKELKILPSKILSAGEIAWYKQKENIILDTLSWPLFLDCYIKEMKEIE